MARWFADVRSAVRGAIVRRWRGEHPLGRLLFVDMLAWGTILNLTTTATSLVLLALGTPAWAAVVAWTACWPWNAFLCLSVWRTADGRGGALAAVAKPLSALWTVGISVV